jgi:lipopolysaccharide/colanic/teichoic acid biosynthesis glycosyltransferase
VIKRGVDALVSLTGLVLLSPLLAAVAVWVKLDSTGPVFFRQERIGRRFRPFLIYKFRTMAAAAGPAPSFAIGDESRVTNSGRLLRRMKIDELPQLFNVLMGDMSLVGPRPEVRQFVELFRDDYAEILLARPGMTDLASIKYRNEAALLSRVADPHAEYVGRILPDKIHLAREYVRRSSLSFDLVLIVKTLWLVAGGKVAA